MGISFVAAICPSCGAQIRVDESRRSNFCQYCGVQILVQDAVQRVQKTITFDRSGELENLLIRAGQFVTQGLFDRAEALYERALMIDARNEEALAALDRLSRRVVRNNLHVARAKPSTGWDSRVLYQVKIDGVVRPEDPDEAPLDLMLPIGVHKVRIVRSAIESNEMILNVQTKYDDFTVLFTGKLFTIEAKFEYKRF